VRSLGVQLTVCVLLAMAIRVAAFSVGAVERLDGEAVTSHALPRGGAAEAVATALARPFDPAPYVLIVTAVVLAAVLRGRTMPGLVAAGVMVGAALTTQALKHLLASSRIPPGYWYFPPDAWPSGHTTAAASLAFALVLIVPRGRRVPVAIAGAALTAAVGAALVLLGKHFPSDALGAVCVAAAWGAIGFHVLELSRARRAGR
jgi:membrane-associated phospholipid phosphatase